ncbi:MAG: hypothetical protein ACFFG0_06350 [Candidatus Thorarchaeota archaeon]
MITKEITISNHKDIKNIDKFLKNPVILFNHDPYTLPIGKIVAVEKDKYTGIFPDILMDQRKISQDQLEKLLKQENVNFEAMIDQEGNLLEISLMAN